MEEAIAAFAEAEELKLVKIAQPLRAALAGRAVSPSVFDMMCLIGRDETIARIGDATAWGWSATRAGARRRARGAWEVTGPGCRRPDSMKG